MRHAPNHPVPTPEEAVEAANEEVKSHPVNPDPRCQWVEDGPRDNGARCEHDRVPRERYCPRHRRVMLTRMRLSGYLTPLPTEEKPYGRCVETGET